ncbi:MAG TPA: alkaline phosphatase family protein [Solirubrobacteraceae bacterium]|nr:alkaline phosphatase family protein [Solirubrobacteraceae bacterium]
MCALLVLVFLAFGVLLGRVARSPVEGTLASASSPTRVVLPASGASASAPAEGSAASSSEPTAPAPQEAAEGEPAGSAVGAPAKSASSKAPAAAGGPQAGGGSKAPEQAGSKEEGGAQGSAPAGAPAKALPPIKHVFVIMLSDEPYASVFGPSSAAPYLSSTLEHEGELLVGFDAVAHEELADEAALLSGQGPTAETAANCPDYTAIAPTGIGPDAQVLGDGCVYPASVQTLPDQLQSRRLSWRAYVQGIDEPGASAGACAHPALGAADPTAEQAASTGAYATFRNPFVYFASIVDSPSCAQDDVGLASLAGDLAQPRRTPSFAYVVPDRCHDGNPTPCTPGAPAGMAPADAFLRQVVLEITGSKAFKQNGLLVITVDEAPSGGAFADSSSCCGQPLFPNAPAKTVTGSPAGGGLVGALLLSPYVKAASTDQEPYDDFSLLRTIERLFGLGPLGYAALPGVKAFEPAMFTAKR